MRARVLLTTCLLMLSLAAQSQDRSVGAAYGGGDGSTREKAVLVISTHEIQGVEAEYAWIEEHLPGATIESVALVRDKSVYDVFKVTLPSGESRFVYFDISMFFGTPNCVSDGHTAAATEAARAGQIEADSAMRKWHESNAARASDPSESNAQAAAEAAADAAMRAADAAMFETAASIPVCRDR